MPYGEIRTVHAILPDGTQIVRYDRSKRWFHETADGRRIKRFRRVSDAARLVHDQAGQAFIGRPEGSYFAKYVEAEWAGTPLQPIQRYTDAGLRQAIDRAQRKYQRDLEQWKRSTYLHELTIRPYLKTSWGEEFLARNYGAPRKPDILKRKAG